MGGAPGLSELANAVTGAALRAADPAAALGRHWRDPGPGPVFLAAFGKASAAMARRACELLGARVTAGVVIAVPERIAGSEFPAGVAVFAADHPLPTERNVHAAEELRARLGAFADEHWDGTVVCLISGGGSAHVTLPAGDLTIEDLRAVSEALQRAGAPIEDLNAVRKHSERLKGGRLTALAGACRVEAYVLSDVIGDALDAIASGPTAADPTTFAGALGVLERYGCRGAAPAVTAWLERCVAAGEAETPKQGDRVFARVKNTVIANNRAAVEAVKEEVERRGITVSRVRFEAVGEAADVGRWLAREVSVAGAGFVIVGGEPTVRVGQAQGRGGPSQELALACAVEMERLGIGERAGVIAFSTDGVDGPTDAAGAAVCVEEVGRAKGRGVDASSYLSRHDSHGFFDQVGALVRTGPTGTNVNHVAVGWMC